MFSDHKVLIVAKSYQITCIWMTVKKLREDPSCERHNGHNFRGGDCQASEPVRSN